MLNVPMSPAEGSTAYSDDLGEEEGLSVEEDGSVDEELEEEDGLEGSQRSDSDMIEDETAKKDQSAAGKRASGRASSVVSEEPLYSDSFGTAPQQSSSVSSGVALPRGRAQGGKGSVASGMTDIEAEHARRISQLRREVEEKKRQVWSPTSTWRF